MKNIYSTFQNLKNQPSLKGEGYPVAKLNGIKNHKIGVTKDCRPIFFIKCDPDVKSKAFDSNLEFITIQYNCNCRLLNNNGKTTEGVFTIISLKSNDDFLQEYFVKILEVIVHKLSSKPLLKDVKIEIDKLINLFSKLNKPGTKTIQGLWAELLIIEQSSQIDYMVSSWHSNISDKYDFNDGIDKIEVKSTSKNRRIHNFSLDQITANPGSNLLIASVFAIETGIGVSVSNLVDSIESKLNDKSLIFRLNELVASTLGNDFEKAMHVYFDYQLALDSIAFFESESIPRIDKIHIPETLINVRFDCDLSNLKSIKKTGLKSKLYLSLF